MSGLESLYGITVLNCTTYALISTIALGFVCFDNVCRF